MVNQTLVHLLYITTEGLVLTSDVFLMLISPRSHLWFLVVVGLSCSNDPASYVGGALLLVGSPMPDRSKLMGET